MIQVVTSIRAAHGKGAEAVEFVKGASDKFNKSKSLIVESTPLISPFGNSSTLLIVNKIASYADWAKIQEAIRKSSDDPWGAIGGWGKEFFVPGSLVRRVYEVIE